jgi:AraC-like DNA-binding protein
MTFTTNTRKRELLSYLNGQQRDVFSVARRIDGRRYLSREFPDRLPMLLSLQAYPGYKRMIGENWMHWHDYYEFWVAHGGSGTYRSGNHRFAFAPGDIVLVDPLKLHGVLRMEPAHAPLVVFFRADLVAPNGAEVDRGFLAAWDRRPEKIAPRLEADSTATAPVHAAVLQLAQVWFEQERGEERELNLKLHLLEVLAEFRRAFLSRGHTTPDSLTHRAERLARLSRVLEYVGERCHATVLQPEVARFAGMSTSRFRVFFKDTTGWGFGDYVRDLRLERAARRLRETMESVAEIAYQTGFADQSHLQRLFKAKYEISPLAYRQRHQARDKAHP